MDASSLRSDGISSIKILSLWVGQAPGSGEKPQPRKEEFLFSDSDDMDDAKAYGVGQGETITPVGDPQGEGPCRLHGLQLD